MKPLSTFSEKARRAVRGVLFDIDDTLTTDGHLTAEAYAALESLQQAGLLTIPITGRPAGWCDHIARMWPVDGIVGENGALYFRYLRDQHRMIAQFHHDDGARTNNRRRLGALRDRILAEVPGCALASDQAYREADLAIDYCEDVALLPSDQVNRIVALFEEAGATAKVSSIHVNGWFGDYNKLSMTKRLFAEQFDTDLDAAQGAFVFVGDSPNDAPMFAHFDHAVGVANVVAFADQLTDAPTYVTRNRSGAGFAELAAALLAVR
ncbi:MAG: HAD-IIB family hydrolase [Alphaproteobacteria bacterium]|nr:HAD-IIB family hydrolase [Alphaproteobacteria bacterium]